MSLTANTSENIAKLTEEHKGQRKWPRRRIVAAGMNAARQHGADMPKKPMRRKMPKGMHKMPNGRMMADEDMPKKKSPLMYLGKG